MDQVRYGIVVRYGIMNIHSAFLELHVASPHMHGGILVLHICFYTFSVIDAATIAPASSSQPCTTTQTTENPSSHVVGMYDKFYACTAIAAQAIQYSLCTYYRCNYTGYAQVSTTIAFVAE